jgi:hypothetical protein
MGVLDRYEFYKSAITGYMNYSPCGRGCTSDAVNKAPHGDLNICLFLMIRKRR